MISLIGLGTSEMELYDGMYLRWIDTNCYIYIMRVDSVETRKFTIVEYGLNGRDDAGKEWADRLVNTYCDTGSPHWGIFDRELREGLWQSFDDFEYWVKEVRADARD